MDSTEPKQRCPKGTRRNKQTEICEAGAPAPAKKLILTKKNKTTGKQENVKLVIAELPGPDQEPAEEPVPAEEQEPASATAQELTENAQKNAIELAERDMFATSERPYLYPNLNDPNFNINIAARKEFNDTQYDGEIKEVISEAAVLGAADFELAPHQLFVRNFLSFQTPYNSLLLYHGLGSGKTCSAISIAEEMRDYLIQMNIANRIIVVASPNVQDNFKLQLFDERKLQLIDGLWNIRSCTGNKFLKEINPMNMKGLTKNTIIAQINRIIHNYYVFLGYTEFANYIKKKSAVSGDTKNNSQAIKQRIKQHFSNRLIIIDEVHNIRIADDNPDKKRIAQELFKLVTYADNVRLLLLSATPMYNSYKEIVWLVNIMNLNDRRSLIEIKDVFKNDDAVGAAEDAGAAENDIFTPNGRALLERKATGYISYVRGENPYTFPYKLWPADFAPAHTFENHPRPTLQLNGKPLLPSQHTDFLSLYLVPIGSYQQKGYDYVINKLKLNHKGKKVTTFANLEAFGYTVLQKPVQALNMVYPDERLAAEEANENIDVADLVGASGLARLMTFTKTVSPPARYDFEYRPSPYGRIFAPDQIGKYSGKFSTICDRILNSVGVVLVYSQYIDGGLLPLALALEERGFTRAGTVRSLFKTPPTEKIDAVTFQTKKEMDSASTSTTSASASTSTRKFMPAKYVMITGDEGLSPDNVKDISLITDLNNTAGQQVKVVLISLAGSEGLDLKFIRQVHIVEPWYNMNRNEQIIGRAVRAFSHKDLPFAQRNVELYLYGTLLAAQVEAVDLYVYRLAELKAVQIGKVSRLLKEVAVDCILNAGQANFREDEMQQTVQIELPSRVPTTLAYKVGDKPHSAFCDYMANCNFTCKPTKVITPADINSATYGEAFMMMNNDKIIAKIKMLMQERVFYRKPQLVARINDVKVYPEKQINAALTQLIEDKSEYITDIYKRLGHLINIGDLYLFQPLELTNPHIGLLERSMPVEFKHEVIQVDLAKALPKLPKGGPKAQVQAQVKEASAVKAPAPKEAMPIPMQEPMQEPSTNEPSSNEPSTIEALALLTRLLKEKYAIATTAEIAKRGEDNWYVFESAVIDEMERVGVSKAMLLEALIAHICDELSFEDKLLLLNYFAQGPATLGPATLGPATLGPATLSPASLGPASAPLGPFAQQMQKYLLKNQMTNKGITGLFLQNKGELQLFIKQPNGWHLAEGEDKHDLEPNIAALKQSFAPVKEKFNNIIGFMMNFRQDEDNIVFKIKVFAREGIISNRNKGVKCYGKSIKMVTDILGDEMKNAYFVVVGEKYKDLLNEKTENRVKKWFTETLNKEIYKKYVTLQKTAKERREQQVNSQVKPLLTDQLYKKYLTIQKKYTGAERNNELLQLLGAAKSTEVVDLLTEPVGQVDPLVEREISALLGPDTYQLYLAVLAEKPDDLEVINHIHSCVIQEMFLRVYDLQRKAGKRWFLSPEEAMLIDIEKLSL